MLRAEGVHFACPEREDVMDDAARNFMHLWWFFYLGGWAVVSFDAAMRATAIATGDHLAYVRGESPPRR